MAIASPGSLPRRVFVSIRFSYERSTGAAELVPHRRGALALPPLSPHVPVADFGASSSPLPSHTAVQGLGPLVYWFVFVLQHQIQFWSEWKLFLKVVCVLLEKGGKTIFESSARESVSTICCSNFGWGEVKAIS